MKRIVRLTENDLVKLIKNVIKEDNSLKAEFNYILSSEKFQSMFGRREVVNDIVKFCKKGNYSPTVDIDSVMYNVGIYHKKGRGQGIGMLQTDLTGRGVSNEAANGFSNELSKLKTIYNFCALVNRSEGKKIAGEQNIMDIFDEISSNSVFDQKILQVLRNLTS